MYFGNALDHKFWKTSDEGFNHALKSHLEEIKNRDISEEFFQEVLAAVKYCEHSYDVFGPDFNFEIYSRAQDLCQGLEIFGNMIGEDGLD